MPVIAIQQMSSCQLLDLIRNKLYTSEQIVKYYLMLSKKAQEKTNCIAELMTESALRRARELDRHIATTGDTVGPLHGLPISIKECFSIAGTYSTGGYAQYTANKMEHTGVAIDILIRAGAIPIVKTNVPQTLLVNESANLIYGTTTNPWNAARTAGGSSGGESALIACGGAPLGCGSDVGGSIRIPCHFSGTMGLKPTVPRLTHIRLSHLDFGNRSVPVAFGPMGRYVEDLELFMRVLHENQYQYDFTLPPVDWRLDIFRDTKPLKIGYYVQDDFYQISGACARAVEEAAQALSKRGHKVVLFRPPSLTEAVKLYFDLMLGDDGNCLNQLLEKEYTHPCMKNLMALQKVPLILQRVVLFVFTLLGKKRYTDIMSHFISQKKGMDIWKLHLKRDKYCSDFLTAMADMDVVIAPGGSLPAVLHNSGQMMLPLVYQTFVYNLLNFPVGTIPVTRVTTEDINLRQERDVWDKLGNDTDLNSEGLPIGVQVVARPFRDELVLRVMKEIEDSFRFHDKVTLPSLILKDIVKF